MRTFTRAFSIIWGTTQTLWEWFKEKIGKPENWKKSEIRKLRNHSRGVLTFGCGWKQLFRAHCCTFSPQWIFDGQILCSFNMEVWLHIDGQEFLVKWFLNPDSGSRRHFLRDTDVDSRHLAANRLKTRQDIINSRAHSQWRAETRT